MPTEWITAAAAMSAAIAEQVGVDEDKVVGALTVVADDDPELAAPAAVDLCLMDDVGIALAGV